MDSTSPTATASISARDEPFSASIDPRLSEDATIPRRVLVATDASATSAGAERAGAELAARIGASLVFVSVIDPSRLRLPGGLFHTRVDQVRNQREAALARLVATARVAGVAAQFLIWEGDPGSSVIDAADAEGADVIIVGSHDRGPIGRRLLGSVSSYVVRHARGQVVIIRPDQGLADVWPVPSDGSATA
jgi:nucleotide-binding universal stress UspA family protein